MTLLELFRDIRLNGCNRQNYHRELFQDNEHEIVIELLDVCEIGYNVFLLLALYSLINE